MTRVRLLRSARINHEAGDIVEVSPAQADFLISTGSAVLDRAVAKVEKAEKVVVETPEAKKAPRKTAKK